MVGWYMIFIHQLPGQGDGGLHGCILKVPVPARISLASFVSDTQLDSDTVGVAALRMLVGLRAAVPGNVLVLHRLPNLSVKSHKVMALAPMRPLA